MSDSIELIKNVEERKFNSSEFIERKVPENEENVSPEETVSAGTTECSNSESRKNSNTAIEKIEKNNAVNGSVAVDKEVTEKKTLKRPIDDEVKDEVRGKKTCVHNASWDNPAKANSENMQLNKKVLHISPLPCHWKNVDLHDLIKKYVEAVFKRVLHTRRNKLFGEIVFEDEESAAAAIKTIHGLEVPSKRGFTVHLQAKYPPMNFVYGHQSDKQKVLRNIENTSDSVKTEEIRPVKIKTETPNSFLVIEQSTEQVKIRKKELLLSPFAHCRKEELFGLNPNFLESLNIKPPLTNAICVSNLDECVTAMKIREVFSMAGTVLFHNISTNHTAFVMYEHPLEAVQAISMFHNKKLFSKILTVELCNSDIYLKMQRDLIDLPEGLEDIGPGFGYDGAPVSSIFMLSEITKIKNVLLERLPKLDPTMNGQALFTNLKHKSKYMLQKPTAFPFLTSPLHINPLESKGSESTGEDHLNSNDYNNPIEPETQRQESPRQPGLLSKNTPPHRQPLLARHQTPSHRPSRPANPAHPRQRVSPLLPSPSYRPSANHQPAPYYTARNSQYPFKPPTQQKSQSSSPHASPTAPLQLHSSIDRKTHPNINNPLQSTGPNQTPDLSSILVMLQTALSQLNSNNSQNLAFQSTQNLMGVCQNAQMLQNMQGIATTPIMDSTSSTQIQQLLQNLLNMQNQNQPNMQGLQNGVPGVPSVSEQEGAPASRSIGEWNIPTKRSAHNKSKKSSAEPISKVSDMLMFVNLPSTVTQDIFKYKMEEVGDLILVEVLGEGRALVKFRDVKDAERCFKLFNRSKVDGETIFVRKM